MSELLRASLNKPPLTQCSKIVITQLTAVTLVEKFAVFVFFSKCMLQSQKSGPPGSTLDQLGREHMLTQHSFISEDSP